MVIDIYILTNQNKKRVDIIIQEINIFYRDIFEMKYLFFIQIFFYLDKGFKSLFSKIRHKLQKSNK